MKTLQTLALSMLMAVTGAFSATVATAPAAPPSGVMPDLNHVWSPDEIVTATNLAAAKVPLLTYATPDGKAFFDRLRAPDYFKELTDSKVPLKTRLQQSSTMFAANSRLLIAYAAAADRGQAGHAELSALDGLQMNYGSLSAILTTQVLATANPKDPKVATIKASLDTGFSGLLAMTLKLVQLPHFLPPNDVTYELRTMASSLVSMKVFLTPASRAALSQQLTAQRAQLTNPVDQQVIEDILHTLAG